MLARQVAQGSEVCAMNKDVAAEGSSVETFFMLEKVLAPMQFTHT